MEDTSIPVDQPPRPSSVRPFQATVESGVESDGGKYDTKLAGVNSNSPPSVSLNDLKGTSALTKVPIEVKPSTREYLHRPFPQCAWRTTEELEGGQLRYNKVLGRGGKKHECISDTEAWAGNAPRANFEIKEYGRKLQLPRHDARKTFKHPEALAEETPLKEESTTFEAEEMSEYPQTTGYFRVFPRRLEDIPSKPVVRTGEQCRHLIWFCVNNFSLFLLDFYLTNPD